MLAIMVLVCVLFSGCSEVSEGPPETFTGSISQTETKTTDGEGIASVKNAESTTVPDRDKESETITSEAVPGTGEESQKETTTQEDLPAQSSSSVNSTENDNSSSSNTTQVPTTSSQEVTTETVPTGERAGKKDALEVANRVLYYINKFRDVPATYLPGLAEYAQYRSRQIIANFAHDTKDQRAAATALEYGEYVVPSEFGGSGEPYYSANAREAIAKAGYVGTVDEVAYRLATLVKSSQGHWNYIGSSEYCYIAVGVTFESDMWYCAITVASINSDKA